MKRLMIDILNHMDRIKNLNELLPLELAQTTKWKDEGKLCHLFIKEDNTGAILIMDGIDVDSAKSMLSILPMHSYFEKVDYFYIDEQY